MMFSRHGVMCAGAFGRTLMAGLMTAGARHRQRVVPIVKVSKPSAIELRPLSTHPLGNRYPININLGPMTLLAAGSLRRVWPSFVQPKRDHVKFSMMKGRQKTVRAVVDRFFRLHWGGWIHPMIGRKKRLWKKSWKKRQRLRRHLLCTPRYNRLFDHMTTRFWKRPKYYVDDPYEPYHVRNDFPYKFYNRRRSPT